MHLLLRLVNCGAAAWQKSVDRFCRRDLEMAVAVSQLAAPLDMTRPGTLCACARHRYFYALDQHGTGFLSMRDPSPARLWSPWRDPM